MPPGRLTALQARLLVELAPLSPPWTLSGGAALAGFHTCHRATRDLDLFWQGRDRLDAIPGDARRRLEAAGLKTATVQTADAFCRLEVTDGAETILVDLVADPVPLAEPPGQATVEGLTFRVDTRHQILVNKLCALLSRSELRDLVDVAALLRSGGDLVRALSDCPRQDAGFSPLAFAWAVRGLPLGLLAERLGWQEAEIRNLETFREGLVDSVLAAARP